jgi:hypothetical protein
MHISNPSFTVKSQSNLIASASNVNANFVGLFPLIFDGDTTAENSVPSLILITRKSGILYGCIAEISLNGQIIKVVTQEEFSLIGSTTKRLSFSINSLALPSQGQYSINITTLNGSTGTFDVEIYGTKV